MTADHFQHYPPGEPPAGPTLIDLVQGIHGHMGTLVRGLPSAEKIRREEADNLWALDLDPVPMPAPVSGFSVLDVPQFYSPSTGEHWDVHRIAATGFTAGSVLAWLNLPPGVASSAAGTSQQGGLAAIFSSAGVNYFGKMQCHLRSTDRLVFVGTGLTVPAGGQVLISLAGVRIADGYLGRYLI